MKKIFGYGSLINTQFRLDAIPTAHALKPAYIKGFIREFSVWDPAGFTTGEFKNIGFWALNITKSNNPKDRVNGVIFEVSEEDFHQLLKREKEYQLIKTPVYNYTTDEYLGEVELFSAPRVLAHTLSLCEAQQHYLNLCSEGAKNLGESFYEEFLATTYLNGKKLSELV